MRLARSEQAAGIVGCDHGIVVRQAPTSPGIPRRKISSESAIRRFLPSSRQMIYSGVTDLFTGTAPEKLFPRGQARLPTLYSRRRTHYATPGRSSDDQVVADISRHDLGRELDELVLLQVLFIKTSLVERFPLPKDYKLLSSPKKSQGYYAHQIMQL